MGDDRSAMYSGWREGGGHTREWGEITKAFLQHAFAGKARVVECPCEERGNHRYFPKDDVQLHLCKFGFMLDYLVWRGHGEVQEDAGSRNPEDTDQMDEMLTDLSWEYEVNPEEHPQPEQLQKFYRLLAASEEKVHEGTNVTILQAVTRLMAMKAKYNIANKCYNDFIKLIIYLIPANHKLRKDLYQSKKMMYGLGMNYEKIDAYENNCMLFLKEDKDLTHCTKCNKSRYIRVKNVDDEEYVTTKVPI